MTARSTRRAFFPIFGIPVPQDHVIAHVADDEVNGGIVRTVPAGGTVVIRQELCDQIFGATNLIAHLRFRQL